MKRIEYKGLEEISYFEEDKYDKFEEKYTQFYRKLETRPGYVSSTAQIAPYVREVLDHLDIDKRVSLIDGSLHVGEVTINVQSEALFILGYQISGGGSPIGVEGYVTSQRKARVKEGCLGNVMAITGHELGHLFTSILFSQVREEAKAYAFEYAWCREIHRHNIAGLGNTILGGETRSPLFLPNPHREAKQYVMDQIRAGRDPLELYQEIANSEGYPGFSYRNPFEEENPAKEYKK